MKRLIRLLIVTASISAMMIIGASAVSAAEVVDEGTIGDSISWVLDDEGTLTIDGSGEVSCYQYQTRWSQYKGTIRKVIIGEGITSIGDYAFRDCSKIKSITIPNSVSYIGSYSFSGCSGLVRIAIPEGVTAINNRSFANCSSLKEITIPEGVTSIGEYAFTKCTSLKEITIPEGVTSIGQYAFDMCFTLATVDIPESVVFIGASAFDCTNLTQIRIPEGVTCIKEGTFNNCSNLTEITIPGSVTSIERAAFMRCSRITEIEIPNSVESIGPNPFADCTNLTKVTLSNNMTSITDYCFARCSKLKTIIIPDSIKTIGEDAFLECSSLTQLTIPNSVKIIDDYAFSGCSRLAQLTIPDSVTVIGTDAFDKVTTLIVSYGSSPYSYVIENNLKYDLPDGHSFGDWVVTKEADCTNGIKEQICSTCGYKNTETIPALGHTWKHITNKATLTKSGSEYDQCTRCSTKKGTTTIYYPKTFTLSTTAYTYSGTVKKPAVTVKNSAGKTLSTASYTVTYSKNKYVGKATAKVTFKGKYSGIKLLYFKINPKGTSLSKLTPKKKAFTVTWKKQATQTTGYQIQYSLSSKFASGNKLVTVGKTGTTSKTISKLKAKKTYYVRVRTYKTVSGTKYYSAWSAKKYVKTK